MSTLNDLKTALQSVDSATMLTITVNGSPITVKAGDLDSALGVTPPVAVQQTTIANPVPIPPLVNASGVLYATTVLNVRSAPSVSGTILEKIDAGTKVAVQTTTASVTADGHTWLSVQLADNTVGWCASDYLSDDPPAATPIAQSATTPSGFNGVTDGALFADLSVYNKNVTLAVGKANGIAGIIHKATQGTTYTDPTFAASKAEAAAAGIYFGAYHFGIGDADPVAQAEHLMTVAAGVNVLVLDFEHNPDPSGQTMTVPQAEAFVQHVRQRTGRWPVLYTSPGFWGHNTSPVLAQCPLWVAAWGSAPLIPPPWTTWTFWQFTDGNSGAQPHTVTGIGTGDFDRFNGDAATLKQFFGA